MTHALGGSTIACYLGYAVVRLSYVNGVRRTYKPQEIMGAKYTVKGLVWTLFNNHINMLGMLVSSRLKLYGRVRILGGNK